MTSRTCWFIGEGTRDTYIWQWSIFYGWISIAIVICAISIGIVLKKLWDASRLLKSQNETNSDSKTQKALAMAARRIILYPLIPIVTQILNPVASVSHNFILRESYFTVETFHLDCYFLLM